MPKSDTRFKPNMPRPTNAGRRAGTPNRQLAALQKEIIEASTLLIPDLLKTMDSLRSCQRSSSYLRAEKIFLQTATQMMKLALPKGIPSLDESEDLPLNETTPPDPTEDAK